MANETPQNIDAVLKYYSTEVVPALATALTFDDDFPREILNEIRNSYTHLARANKLGNKHADYIKEVDGAYRHLKRTCLDCIKVSISIISLRADAVLQALEEELQLPNDIHDKMTKLRSRREKLAAYEGEHPTHEAVNRYKTLLIDYDVFREELNAKFTGGTAEERKSARKTRERKAKLWNLLVGFIIGLLTSGIVAFVVKFLE